MPNYDFHVVKCRKGVTKVKVAYFYANNTNPLEFFRLLTSMLISSTSRPRRDAKLDFFENRQNSGKSSDFDIYRVKKCQEHESGVKKNYFSRTRGYYDQAGIPK